MKPLILTVLIGLLFSACRKEEMPQPERPAHQLIYRIQAGAASVVTLKLHRAGITVQDTVHGQVMYYDEARPGDSISLQIQSLAGPKVGVTVEYNGSHLLYERAGRKGYLHIERRLPGRMQRNHSNHHN